MHDLPLRIIAGLAISAAIAILAGRRGALDRSGAAAATLVGATVFAAGGMAWLATLAAFFLSATALGRAGAARKAAVKREFSKSDRRDATQVLANGATAALVAAAYALTGNPIWAAAFVGALATANGDTWATELGILSRRRPWSLVRLARVPRGRSGAVSTLGVLAACGGALLIGVVAAVGGVIDGSWLLASTVLAGVAGALADSLFGECLQARYRCPACEVETEARVHHCGTAGQRVGGLGWFGNDAVNFAATATGALLAALLAAAYS